MNLPNALTLSRLVAIPLVIALLLVRFEGHDQLAAAIFIIFSLTDTADGQIARRRRLVSDLGKFLDPLADKLYVLSVLIVLVQEGLVAAWVVVVIFSRELVITLLRSAGARQGRVIGAAPLGKTKTILQMAAVVFLILQRPYPVLVSIAAIVTAFAVLLTLISGVDYLWRLRGLIGTASSVESKADPLAVELADLLTRNHMTVAVAESCTGGMLGTLITDQPGSSAYFLGGVIAYSNQAKRDELGVSTAVLAKHGAVSREVAIAMAEGVRSRFASTLAAAITGVAGPEADGSSKPVGLTYVAITTARRSSCNEYRFDGDRWSNRREAAAQALRSLIEEARSTARRRERKPA